MKTWLTRKQCHISSFKQIVTDLILQTLRENLISSETVPLKIQLHEIFWPLHFSLIYSCGAQISKLKRLFFVFCYVIQVFQDILLWTTAGNRKMLEDFKNKVVTK
jgi:hypothetical protein